MKYYFSFLSILKITRKILLNIYMATENSYLNWLKVQKDGVNELSIKFWLG